ncbi:hypothetical protein X943_002938 [Babesia divergens]|uniref:Mediator of RNA polymerase II transcription subunit 14 n=1 Tax=Babesia divergens TaxID=32595 RepID=A0AAD9G7I5_BABDI|nr:hypothetical protein X943_002938 [Babesia divergens]
MDDFQVVSFMDLLSQCVSRCVLDWRCFCERQERDESFVDNHVRAGIIQFCRAQREVFLKLYLLSQFMQEQNKLDRILEKVHSLENFLDKCGTEIAMVYILVACPNTPLAVDLLSSGRYTRMPLMLPQLAESAVTNAVPLPPLSINDADLTMARIYNEYHLQFRRSACQDGVVSIECRNGQCIFTRKNFFSITLIYDFASWQALSAVPLLLQQFGCSTDGEARSSFISLMMYAIALYNSTNKGNVFDAIYESANLYCGKLLMERLKGQASDYRGLKLTVTDYKFYLTTDEDQMLISCSDVRPSVGELLVLDVACFPGFKYKRLEGITIRFKMDSCGEVCATIIEIPEILNEINISEHRLDQWLERVASLLEQYQLGIFKYEGNVFMNHSTGELQISGIPLPFTLEEADMLMQVIEVRSTLMTCKADHPIVNSVSRDLLRNIWRRFQCPNCSDHMKVDTTPGMLGEQLKDFVCDFWFYMEDRTLAVHGVAVYEIGLGGAEIVELGIYLYLTVITHDQEIVGNALLALDGRTPLGTIMLTSEYTEYMHTQNRIIGFLRIIKKLSDWGTVTTKLFNHTDTHLVGLMNDVEFTVDAHGNCDSVTQDGITETFQSSEEAYKALTSKLRNSSGV